MIYDSSKFFTKKPENILLRSEKMVFNSVFNFSRVIHFCSTVPEKTLTTSQSGIYMVKYLPKQARELEQGSIATKLCFSFYIKLAFKYQPTNNPNKSIDSFLHNHTIRNKQRNQALDKFPDFVFWNQRNNFFFFFDLS